MTARFLEQTYSIHLLVFSDSFRASTSDRPWGLGLEDRYTHTLGVRQASSIIEPSYLHPVDHTLILTRFWGKTMIF